MKLPSAVENLLKRLPRRPPSDRLAGAQRSLEEEITRRCFTKLLQEAQSPLSQLVLQLHIAEKPDNALSASDVLVHAKRLIAIMEENGMVVIGTPGEVMPFDPTRHELTEPGAFLRSGTPVTVRFPGIAYGATIVRKAAVDQEGNG